MIDCLEKEQQLGGAGGSSYGQRSQQQQHQATNGTHFEAQLASYRLQRQPTLIEVSSNDGQQQQQTDNELIGYYFGSISRDTAEWILKTHGKQADGTYLLRSSGPNDDFVLSLMVNHNQQQQPNNLEVLHYKIVETEDSFVALHGQVGDEKFATIDELIDKAQGVATKPRWPMHRQYLESQILPPTYWGLTVDQIRLAILIKAKQWGFPLLSTLFQAPQQQQQSDELQSSPNVESSNATTTSATTLNNETIRTLIYKSLHEFQPWFHGKISRDEAERRIEEGHLRDGRFLVRERDNYSYAMCISHKKTTKHYRIDVLPTGELAIQDGRKFTSLMALVSHYTIMSDGLWCALTEACPRPIQGPVTGIQMTNLANNGGSATMVQQQQSAYSTAINTLRSYPPQNGQQQQSSMYFTAPPTGPINGLHNMILSSPTTTTSMLQSTMASQPPPLPMTNENIMPTTGYGKSKTTSDGPTEGAGNRDSTTTTTSNNNRSNLICAQQGSVASLRGPIKEWLQTINYKWSQLMASKNQHQSLNSFLFGNQNPLNNHCRHHHHHMSPHHHHHHHRRKCKNGHVACACIHHQQQMIMASANCKLSQANDVTLSRQPFMNLSNQLQIGAGGGGGLTTTGAASGRLSDFSSTTNNNNGNSNNNAGTIGKYQLGAGEVHGVACCQAAICPTTIYRDNLMPKNHQHQHHVAQTAAAPPSFQAASSSSFGMTPQLATSSSLLSCLPQNSGFALNSQSFIGSPLFAVRPTTQQQQLACGQQLGEPQASHHRSGSSNSGSGSGNNLDGEEEVKLISPVQSISAKLNKHISATPSISSPYNLNQDIYGSQTSTALISDPHRLPTSSSSSSGGKTTTLINQQHRFSVACTPAVHLQRGLVTGASRLTTSHRLQQQYKPPVSLAQARVAGQILCGQHAGPAYRYTNCSGIGDENTFRPCLHNHRQLPVLNKVGLRAIDDSHLLTPSTQLAGPAAMAKFVQFQDGQCLRTHRDTQSIQQAYLSSRQQHQLVANSNNGNNNNNLTWNNNQAPPTKEFANATLQHNQFHLAAKNNAPPQVPVTGGYCGGGSAALLVAANNNAAQQQFGKQFNHQYQSHQHHHHQQQQQQQPHQPHQPIQSAASGTAAPVNDEIDLMDCGDSGGFNFKYDPKLIKSSSIETLCGIGVDAEDEDDVDDEINFDAFKTNSELIMSLQSCWLSNTNAGEQHSSILSPIPTTLANNQKPASPIVQQLGNGIKINNSNPLASGQDGSILSSLMRAGEQHQQDDENHELDHLKKKHDLDELTTALLAELTASLKAQVDLKNKRSGFGAAVSGSSNSCQPGTSLHHLPDKSAATEHNQQQHEERVNSEVNPLELINEFDTLLPNNNR